MGTMHTDFCSMVNVQNAIRNYINQIMGLLFYRVELQCLHCRFEFTVLRSNKDYLYAGPVNNTGLISNQQFPLMTPGQHMSTMPIVLCFL